MSAPKTLSKTFVKCEEASHGNIYLFIYLFLEGLFLVEPFTSNKLTFQVMLLFLRRFFLLPFLQSFWRGQVRCIAH